MAATKRKRVSAEASKVIPNGDSAPAPKRRASTRNASAAATVNPDVNGEVFDAPNATRASPDGDINADIVPGEVKLENGISSDQSHENGASKKKGRPKKGSSEAVVEAENAVAAVVDAATNGEEPGKRGKKSVAVKQEGGNENTAAPPAAAAKNTSKSSNDNNSGDPEADDLEEADEEEVKEAIARPPPVHSDYLPLPWKGRLGYACLNTYLRNSNPPVFSSRTCRIQSILEHRHPLQDPTQPEHPTKNRPDRNKPADVELGKRYVESLCLANIKDIEKMLRWNDKYGIKFMRLSSEMFPFASHSEYGYKLAPFASEALAAAGKVVAELGHRVTTHPGQFTQLGSPRKPVIENAIRDLEYHDELLSLLKLPEQQNKDAVMILHMGGIFEGKQETLQRFRENYANLPQGVKNRLVLENDDMGWSVHDILPVCEELNIPMVLDFHHHNIVFDSSQIREGTKDIIDLYPRIKATWDRKGITQKMHYSEPTPPAITPRQRRKHNPRVATLPPCAPDMDLMIEAKDKEQAVFELMRIFKLPGWNTFNDIIPYTRDDDNKVALATIAKKSRSKKKDTEPEPEPEIVPDEDVGMGGPEGRVYWPPGMEEWLRPKKKEIKKKDDSKPKKDTEKEKRELAEAYAVREAARKGKKVDGAAEAEADEEGEESDVDATPATKKAKAAMRKKMKADAAKTAVKLEASAAPPKPAARKGRGKKAAVAAIPEESSLSDLSEGFEDGEEDDPVTPLPRSSSAQGRKASGRAAKKRVSYAEDDEEMEV